MGGFLESLGRTNALSNAGQTIFQNAVNLRKQQEDENQGAISNAINLEKMGMAKEELGIHKAAADREATKFGWAAEEQAKKQKFLKTVVPVDTLLQNARPGSREKLLKLGKDNGWIQDVGGNLVISNENLANAKQYLNANLEFVSQLALTDVADINKEMGPLKQQLAELKATKPDDKTIPILEKRISDLDKQKTEHLNNALEIDKAFQEKIALEKTKAEGRIEGIQIGAEGRAEAARTAADARVDAAKIAADARVEAANARAEAAKAREGAGESKEEKRLVKARTEVRREVEKAFGFSQWLPTATDPLLLKKVGIGKEIAEDIIDNYKQYGLNKEPTPGKAAQMAKIKVEDQLSKKPAAAPVEDKKTKSIRELLFGSPEKK